MFESVKVEVNDRVVTPTTGYYNLKTYIAHTLTYSSFIKSSLLESAGYYGDISGFFQNTNHTINSGFGQRNKLFRVKNKSDGDYKTDGTRFFGKLNLDFNSCTTGLPPGTKVRIEFTRASDEFILMKDTTDLEKYKLKFLELNLYIPVAQLTASVYNQLSSILTTKKLSIHYRRTEIREVSLVRNKVEYYSDNLFSDDIPCRVVVWCANLICTNCFACNM